MTTYTATYSPDDNKLRLYASSRLDAETYARVKAAGFRWAPKQDLFVAPMWTPGREDLLLELAGEIDDEDKSLVERAEERAERFQDYSANRAEDAKRAEAAVSAIADNIPFGQPILIGHHSEKRARRDKEKIDAGMQRTVKFWDQASYWKGRAAGAIRAAKYKELPAVRSRRIKKLESEKRKAEKNKSEADMWLKLWTECGNEQDADLQMKVALRIANMCWLRLPQKEGDKEGWNQRPTAYDALTNSCPSLYAPRTIDEIVAYAKKAYPAAIAYQERWIAHYENRLAYERAMLEESGGTAADQTKPEKGGAVKCWCSPGYGPGKGWSFVQKVNRVTVTVRHKWNTGPVFSTNVPFDKLQAVMSKADVDAARAAGRLVEAEPNVSFYLTDALPETPAPKPEPEGPKPGEAVEKMRETLKAGGVKVVVAPQLFETPREVARRMIDAAGIVAGCRVLEPSAGTGNLVRAAFSAATGADCCKVVAIEQNAGLVQVLETMRSRTVYANETNFRIVHADFLGVTVEEIGLFRLILMNPPFDKGADIKHIEHARKFLKPGGRLVALCANGPRQREKLQPIADLWEDLPAGSFKESGTNVNVALLVIEAEGESVAPGGDRNHSHDDKKN